MRASLPQNRKAYSEDAVVAAYIDATKGTTHSQYRTAAFGSGDVSFAMPKMFDPARRGMSSNGYSTDYSGGLNLIDFDTDENVRENVLLGLRNIAKTHPTIRAIIEVYSRYPVAGIRLDDDDKAIKQFYEDLFLDDLRLEDFLIDVGKSYWVDGMAFVFGDWNDDLALWTNEELFDPLMMRVQRVPFLGRDLVYMHPSAEMKSQLQSNEESSVMFRSRFPQMWEAIRMGKDMPIDDSRITYLANKDRPSEIYGTPVMLRCWNTLRLEDRANAAMQATADRLYAPLVMFTVGGTMPNGKPFIPPASMLEAFRNNLDAALSSDFRAIVTHSGVEVKNVINGDRMSNFKQDVDMYDERLFMAWGLPISIIKPDKGAYATSSLEFQLAGQLMASYQGQLMRIYDKQASLVAEAHHHYEKDEKGQTVYERREVWDPDLNDGQGGYAVKECPKLHFPKLKFRTVNFRDEQKEREFLMGLRNAGIPVANEDIAVGVDIDLDASAKRYDEEQKKIKIDEAKRHESIFEACMKLGQPVPPDTVDYMRKGIAPMRARKILQSLAAFDTKGKSSGSTGGTGQTTGPASYDPFTQRDVTINKTYQTFDDTQTKADHATGMDTKEPRDKGAWRRPPESDDYDHGPARPL